MEEMSRALFCRTQCQVLVQNPCTGWCPSVLCFDACSVNLCVKSKITFFRHLKATNLLGLLDKKCLLYGEGKPKSGGQAGNSGFGPEVYGAAVILTTMLYRNAVFWL